MGGRQLLLMLLARQGEDPGATTDRVHETENGEGNGMDPVTVLQRLSDSEINVTITTIWDGGYDFALISYMELEGSRAANRLRENVHFS